jgi:hypothetical protein
VIEPKDVTLGTKPDGTARIYVLSKFPAVAGREIVAKYPLSGLPKLGDYKVNEETMLKLMCYVGVPRDGAEPLMLTTRALVDNHVPDWETLAQLEGGMLEYNCSFFGNGKASTFFAGLGETARTWILSTLTVLSAQSSPPTKPPSTS